MKRLLSCLLVAACVAACLAEPSPAQTTFGTLLGEMVNRDQLAVHPTAGSAYQTAQASSYDRMPTTLGAPAYFANGDHTNFLGRQWVDGAWEYIMMEDTGPGAITRWWMTSSADAGDVRVYVDGGATPVLSGPIRQVLGANSSFGTELSFKTRGSPYSGVNLYAPIPYSQGVKVTYRGPLDQAVYYNVNYRRYDPAAAVQSYSTTDPSVYASQRIATHSALQTPTVTGQVDNEHTQNAVLTAGADTVYNLDGMGAIRQLRLNVTGADQVAALKTTFVELTFDGQRTVRVPVGEFFGNGDGSTAKPYNSFEDFYRTVASGGTMTSRWVMPYQQAAQVRIVNEGTQSVNTTLRVDSGQWTWDAGSMHFHANSREETAAKTRAGNGTTDFRYLTVRGQGVYAGDTLSLRNGSSSWWGEGDEKVYIDYIDANGVGHDAPPNHIGTGSEDYYGYAWGHAETFSTAFINQPIGQGNNTAGGRTVNSRVRALDAVPFDESFKFDIEMWHWAETQVDYGVTTYWYGRPGASAMRTAADLAADYRVPPKSAGAGLPDTAGDGQWIYLSSSDANPSAAGAQTAPLAYGSVGNAGHQGYGGGQNGSNLAAISNQYLFVDGDVNVGVQGAPGYHELALHPAGMAWSGGFEGDAEMPFAVARWIAGPSSAGLANINGSVRNFVDTADSVDFHIFVDGQLEFTAEGIIGTMPETYFDFDVTLDEGSIVDFVLGNGGAGNLYGDESLLRAIILVLESPAIQAVPGDANRDGRVDAEDATALADNWSESNADWFMGDFTGDGHVDAADASILAANWGHGVSETTPVPEPGSMAVLIAVALTLFTRRSRHASRNQAGP